MIRSVFKAPWAVKRIQEGPLGPHSDSYIKLVREMGYSRLTVRHQVLLMSSLNKWLVEKHVELSKLDQDQVDRFIRERGRKNSSFTNRGNGVALNLLLGVLRRQGVIPTPTPPALDVSDRAIVERDFGEYLRRDRALVESTIKTYSGFAHQFLSEYGTARSLDLSKLSASEVTSFVLRHAYDHGHGRARLMVPALRSFFNFLRLRGDISTDFYGCIPPIANWRLANLPKFMEPNDVKRLLKACDRKTTKGRRDYALLLLIARLGLRACEVVVLTLDDINWQAGEITIHGKGKRLSCFPLPQDVGEALADYLRNGRPACSSRRVFIRTRAPIRGFANSANVGTIVSRTLGRAGLNPPCKGAHLLRHTAAVGILRRGASLPEVGEILRHRNVNTTAIYAKVDLPRLKGLARQWPRTMRGGR